MRFQVFTNLVTFSAGDGSSPQILYINKCCYVLHCISDIVLWMYIVLDFNFSYSSTAASIEMSVRSQDHSIQGNIDHDELSNAEQCSVMCNVKSCIQ